jgi:putative nucleotidyltransferase with HDIG domain
VRAYKLEWRARVAEGIAGLGCVGCAVWWLLLDHGALLDPLALALFASVLIAGFTITRWDHSLAVSGAFVSQVLAIGFLGPAAAAAIETTAEVPVWLVERYRRASVLINGFAIAAPNLIAASAFQALAPDGGAGFYALLAAAGILYLVLNYLIVTVLTGMVDGESAVPRLRPFIEMAPSTAINIVLALAIAGIYQEVGLGGAIFAIGSIFAFMYMSRLVVKAEDRAQLAKQQAEVARRRARQYAALSWGVLSGLIRTLNERDPRAARHAAAVAAFARDIAAEVGMPERDQELAHTAGLLHDIGRFGLSDRVMERDTKLTDDDWRAIRRHPALGADMLKDLGVYGPVADIVRHHHERVDGRGYPDKLKGDEIPEIAKIVAVAEVYDTLTADDTYRTPVSSFQALTELRRVAGTQLETRYVEALSALLAGRSTDYRHADAADFDRELDLERRLSGAEAAPAQDAEESTAQSA